MIESNVSYVWCVRLLGKKFRRPRVWRPRSRKVGSDRFVDVPDLPLWLICIPGSNSPPFDDKEFTEYGLLYGDCETDSDSPGFAAGEDLMDVDG